MAKLLCNNKLLVRFLALYGLGLVLFLLAWSISYRFLPEGILRGRTAAAALAGEEAAGSHLPELLRITAVNIGMLLFFIVLPNRLLKLNGYPLGYLPPLMWSVMYGITLGTNSFAIPLPERMVPSLSVLGRSGLYEIAAYILVAASTYCIATTQVRRLFLTNPEPVVPKPGLRENINWVGFVLAILLLVAANAWEAYQIVALG